MLKNERVIQIEIDSANKVPMHIDGEPFEIAGKHKINIKLNDKVPMLLNETSQDYLTQVKIFQVLEKAEKSKFINNEQKEILLNEFAKTIGNKQLKIN